MHVVMFSMRRAFHLSAEVGLLLTDPFGLTPARFDLLQALRLWSLRNGLEWVKQVSLRELVGTSEANISRMLTSLEKLGLVRRRRDDEGRSRGVKLTRKGRSRLARATEALIRKGAAHRAVQAFFPRDARHTKEKAEKRNFKTLVRLSRSLGRIRRTLGDRGRLEYLIHVPFRPPEIGCVAG
jgi:DNA-binding MarR family transcriptional regulator